MNVGDEVQVTLTGTVVKNSSHDSCDKIRSDGGYDHYIYPGDSSIQLIVKKKPFKPNHRELYQVGDFGRWLVIRKTSYGELTMMSSAGVEMSPEKFWNEFGARAKRIVEA
jgi:hypothetical protein